MFLLTNLYRRRLGLKHGLIVLCLVTFANLSEAQNNNSKLNYTLNINPYPLSRTLNGSIQEKNVTVKKISDNDTMYCLNPECIHTATRILNFMNASLEPCDNFYKFACGQYMRKHEQSAPLYTVSIIKSFQTEINKKIGEILEQVLKPAEPKYVKLMKTFYQNCMNSRSDIREIIQRVVIDLITKIDGWSYLVNNTMQNENFQWEKYQAKIINETHLLTNSFFELTFNLDIKNNSYRVFHIQQELGHRNSPLSLTKQSFPDFIKDISFEDLNAKIQKVNEILNDIYISDNDKQLEVYDRMTVKELEGNYSNILWREIFNGMLQPTTKIRDDDIVLVSDRSFFEKFNKKINNISKRDQAIYVTWSHVINIFIKNEFLNIQDQEDWDACTDITRELFRNAVGALYVKNYVNEETSNKHIDELITNIFHQFNITIENTDWLDQKTKAYALEKLSLLYAERQTIYKISDDKEYDELFTNLEITTDDYFESFWKITKFMHELQTQSYRVPLNHSSFLLRHDATTLNAFNEINLNSFGISPGIFQGIFFNESRPMYLNYGAIGSITGHEFAHGFDSSGKHYDKYGNLNDWWEATSQEHFANKTQCFISQYQDYAVEKFNLSVSEAKASSIRTQTENIADNVGVNISYSAYQKWVKDHGPEPMLPGLNYTQSQLFWISYAQVNCQKSSLTIERILYNKMMHSLPEFRIIVSLSNHPEFVKDFHCTSDSKMNPKSKCSVW